MSSIEILSARAYNLHISVKVTGRRRRRQRIVGELGLLICTSRLSQTLWEDPYAQVLIVLGYLEEKIEQVLIRTSMYDVEIAIFSKVWAQAGIEVKPVNSVKAFEFRIKISGDCIFRPTSQNYRRLLHINRFSHVFMAYEHITTCVHTCAECVEAKHGG